MNLKYLFVATLLNNQKIRQTKTDVCPTDPKRTAFWDLCLKHPNGEGMVGPDGWLLVRPDIKTFELFGDGKRVLVDLITGRFKMDGKWVYRIGNDELIVPEPFMPLTLVYFRRRQEHMNTGGGYIGSDCAYHIGWKAPNGQEQTLVLD